MTANQTEDRLRSAFADAAGTVREDELRHEVPMPPHRRLAGTGRARILLPAAAAAAVLAVVTAGVTVPRILHAGSRGPAPSTSAGSGPTAFVVMTADSSPGPSLTVVVRIRLSNGTLVRPDIRLPEGLVQGRMISPNGKVIAVQTAGRLMRLTFVDTRTGAATRPIAVSDYSDLEAMAPNGRTAYLLESPQPASDGKLPASPGGVLPVNTVTGTAGRFITIPGASYLAISPNGRTVYVSTQPVGASSGPSEVVPIDTATNTPLHPVKVPTGDGSGGIAVSPDGKTVYAVTFLPHGLSAITPISTASNTATKPILIHLPSVSSLGIAPDGRTAWVYNSSPNLVLIDLRDDRALKAIRLPDNFTCLRFTAAGCTGMWEWTLQFAPDSRTAYIYGHGPTVIPVDVATDTLQAPIFVAPHPFNQLAWPPAPLGFKAGYMYAGVSYYSRLASGHDQLHGALSEVDLATGNVKIIKVGLPGLEPASVFLAP